MHLGWCINNLKVPQKFKPRTRPNQNKSAIGREAGSPIATHPIAAMSSKKNGKKKKGGKRAGPNAMTAAYDVGGRADPLVKARKLAALLDPIDMPPDAAAFIAAADMQAEGVRLLVGHEAGDEVRGAALLVKAQATCTVQLPMDAAVFTASETVAEQSTRFISAEACAPPTERPYDIRLDSRDESAPVLTAGVRGGIAGDQAGLLECVALVASLCVNRVLMGTEWSAPVADEALKHLRLHRDAWHALLGSDGSDDLRVGLLQNLSVDMIGYAACNAGTAEGVVCTHRIGDCITAHTQ